MTTVGQILDDAWRRHQAGDVKGAEQIYLQVTQQVPNSPNAWCYLGIARHDLRKYTESIAAYQQALRLQPDFPVALSNMANCYKELGRFAEAIDCCQRALRFQPAFVSAYNNLGVIYVAQNAMDDAIAVFRKAVELDPKSAFAVANLGASLMRVGRFEEGEKYALETLRLDPQHAETRKALAIVTLLRGDLPRGFQEYEWRWKCAQRHPQFPRQVWDGSPLQGRRLVLLYEQGMGDVIHFIRYCKIIKATGGTVSVVCHKQLLQILQGVAGVDHLVAEGAPIPPFDLYLPILSVPRVLKTTLASIPAEVPYLFARADLVEKWRRELVNVAGFKIGIAWQGSPHHHADKQRSVPLAEFAALARVPNVQLFSLQRGFGTEQLAACRDQFAVHEFGDDVDRDAGPFMDTAAIMKNLDMVITSDTSIVHLAGALGVKTWMATSAFPDWRWLLDREDSPWYPTLQLFRQPTIGDWKTVFERMSQELNRIVNSAATTN